MSEELKPCPFCGGEASAEGYATYTPPLKNTRWDDGTNVSEAFFCNCVRCGIDNKVGAIGHQTRADAVEYWNRRADLAQAPAPVRVKALQWIAIDDDDCEVEAYAAGFRYWVFKSGTEEFTLFLNAWEKGHYPTLEAAKAAAQADYEVRILAALEAPDAGVAAELVEALRGLFGLLDAGSLYEPQAYRAREVLAKLGGKANG